MAGLELIAHTEVGSGGAAYVEFTSIPSTYQHLLLKGSGRSERNSRYDGSNIHLNGDTTNGNYSWTALVHAGNIPLATEYTSEFRFNYLMDGTGSNSTGSAHAVSEAWFLDYSSTDKFTAVIGGTSATTQHLDVNDHQHTLAHGHWRSTAVVNAIKIDNGVGDWAQYTTFTLYGLNSA